MGQEKSSIKAAYTVPSCQQDLKVIFYTEALKNPLKPEGQNSKSRHIILI